ncbi:MAG: STAS domain-containing protein [Methylococcaceae bacterium]|nr:STAS domain-containing protein [Methylococcaceae bacterium]
MNITTETKDDATLLRFQEERLDAHNSQELKDYLVQLLENGAKALILDLSEVRFVDSSGLGALLSGYKNAGLRDSRFALAGLQTRVQSMFELTRLHKVFETHPSVEDALASLARGTPHDSKSD